MLTRLLYTILFLTLTAGCGSDRASFTSVPAIDDAPPIDAPVNDPIEGPDEVETPDLPNCESVIDKFKNRERNYQRQIVKLMERIERLEQKYKRRINRDDD